MDEICTFVDKIFVQNSIICCSEFYYSFCFSFFGIFNYVIFFLFRFMLVLSCVLQIVSYLFLVILTICYTSFRKLVFLINPYSDLSFPLNCLFTMLVYSLVFLSLK